MKMLIKTDTYEKGDLLTWNTKHPIMAIVAQNPTFIKEYGTGPFGVVNVYKVYDKDTFVTWAYVLDITKDSGQDLRMMNDTYFMLEKKDGFLLPDNNVM